MAKRGKHIHRYERKNLGKNKDYIVYACNLPHCTHYLPEQLARGKVSLCNRCNEAMIMGALQMTLVRPHHDTCVKRKDEDIDKLKDILEVVEKGL